MNKEIKAINGSLMHILSGPAWYGKPVYLLLEEVDDTKVYIKPNNNHHSLIELLYHMLTWAEFTQKRIEKEAIENMAALEALDWRVIDPSIHTWQKGMAALQASHQKIITLLQSKDDAFLEETVDYRKYNFRFMLNGLIQHNIYHLGQVAYLSKLL
jgi:uncharacterized damage-inducible protein DinB